MNDLIARSNLKKDIARQAMTDWCKTLATAIIDDAPSVDAVQVVRCKGCLYSRKRNQDNPAEAIYSARCLWCDLQQKPIFADDYCSDGEEKK